MSDSTTCDPLVTGAVKAGIDGGSLSALGGMYHLPKKSQCHRRADIQIVRLLYISRALTDPSKSLLKQKHCAVIRKDKWCGRQTLGVLIGCFFFSVFLAPVSFVNFVALKDDWSQATQIAVVSTAGCIATTALSALGFYATGFAPHLASNASNVRQDMLHDMRKSFKQMAQMLVELSCKRGKRFQLAEALIDQIDLAGIKSRLTDEIGSKEAASNIYQPLKRVVLHLRAQGEDDQGYIPKLAAYMQSRRQERDEAQPASEDQSLVPTESLSDSTSEDGSS